MYSKNPTCFFQFLRYRKNPISSFYDIVESRFVFLLYGKNQKSGFYHIVKTCMGDIFSRTSGVSYVGSIERMVMKRSGYVRQIVVNTFWIFCANPWLVRRLRYHHIYNADNLTLKTSLGIGFCELPQLSYTYRLMLLKL